MSRAVLPIGHEELGTEDGEVDADERGYVELPRWVWDKFEEPIPWIFKVTKPVGAWKHSWLRSRVFYGFRYDLGFYGGEYMLQCGSGWTRRGRCHVEVVRWRGRIGRREDICRNWRRRCDWLTVREDRGRHWRDHERIWRGGRSWGDGGVEDIGDDRRVASEVLKNLRDWGIERGGEVAYHGRVSLSEPETVM